MPTPLFLQITSAVILVGGWLYLLSQMIRARTMPRPGDVAQRLTILGLMGGLFGSAWPRYDPGGWISTGGMVLAIGAMGAEWYRQRRRDRARRLGPELPREHAPPPEDRRLERLAVPVIEPLPDVARDAIKTLPVHPFDNPARALHDNRRRG